MKLNFEENGCPVKLKLTKKHMALIQECANKFFIYDRKTKKGYCSNCERIVQYDMPSNSKDLEREIFTLGSIKKNELITCPHCGKILVAQPKRTSFFSNQEVLITQAVGEKIKYAAVSVDFRRRGEEDIANAGYEVWFYAAGELSRKEQRQYLKFGGWGWSKVDNSRMYGGDFVLNIKNIEQIRETISKSFLKNSALDEYYFRGARDWVELMNIAAKHPQVEYLTKQGLKELVIDKIYGRVNYIRPNWKADTIAGFLRLSPQDVDKLKQWGMMDKVGIPTYQRLKKEKHRVTKEDMTIAEKYSMTFLGWKFKVKIGRTSRYLEKYYQNNAPCCTHGASGYSRVRAINDYYDYRKMLKECGYPENEYYLYPPDLAEAHDRLVGEINARWEEKNKEKAAEEKRKLTKRLEKLEKLCYQNEAFLIRPLRSKAEFQKEGRDNINCVATYFGRAISGTTNIFVIRRQSSPDASFVTVEFRDGKILQIRGVKNSQVSEDVKAFANEWLEWMKQKKKKEAA